MLIAFAGLPAVGKTTLARALNRLTDDTASLSPDDAVDAIVSACGF